LAPEQAPALTISERWDADVAIATVRGEIDISTVSIFSEQLGRLAGKNPQRLVIDLAGTTVRVCDLIMGHGGEARSRAWWWW
jgi:hypothetical protein